MNIPPFDLTRQWQAIGPEITQALVRCLEIGQFVLGDEVNAFEAEVAALSGVRHAVGVANGSDALHLALLAAGIGPGDEVITTPFTFFATAGAIARAGARPVFVDIEPGTYNIDVDLLRDAVTEETRAIIPVHLYGLPADMEPLLTLAGKLGLTVIADAAQALGATYQDRPVAAFGHMVTYSFFPTKNLGAFGDGGMVVTNDDRLAERLRMLRVHGARQKYYHEELGYNSRLDELHAAALRVKLKHLPGWMERRRLLAAHYNRRLERLPVRRPLVPAGHGHAYHQYTIAAPHRDALQQALREQGIGSTVYYPQALHLQKVFEDLGYQEGDFPVAERATREVLSLPLFPELTDAEVDHVCDAIEGVLTR